jgi:hypothetical protein
MTHETDFASKISALLFPDFEAIFEGKGIIVFTAIGAVLGFITYFVFAFVSTLIPYWNEAEKVRLLFLILQLILALLGGALGAFGGAIAGAITYIVLRFIPRLLVVVCLGGAILVAIWLSYEAVLKINV